MLEKNVLKIFIPNLLVDDSWLSKQKIISEWLDTRLAITIVKIIQRQYVCLSFEILMLNMILNSHDSEIKLIYISQYLL